MPTAATIMQNVANNFTGLHTLLLYISGFMGVCLIVLGIYRYAHYQRTAQQGGSVMGYTWTLLAGSLLVALPETINEVLSQSIFNSDSYARTGLEYQSLPTSTPIAALFTLLVGFITIYGWVGVIKGLYIVHTMSKAGGGRDGEMWNAMTHLLAGCAAANIMYVTDVIAATMGVTNYFRNFVPN